MNLSPISPVPTPHSAAHDLAALKRGNLSPAEERTAVAGQFEAIMLRQFLQDSVGSMMGGGGKGGDGGGGNVYGFMLTDTLADKLSQGRGMGLAPMIAKQLTPRGLPSDATNHEANKP